jgi:hypothetical protein
MNKPCGFSVALRQETRLVLDLLGAVQLEAMETVVEKSLWPLET